MAATSRDLRTCSDRAPSRADGGASPARPAGAEAGPVHFVLSDANGTTVQAGAPPKWLTPVKVSATSAPLSLVDIAPSTEDSGSTFRYTPALYQYH
ncbi:hypothetical protein [Kineococcus glutinatus]|uniref:Uncharacterized protein n=1 Tax=Kineococcus glutinatus TaxID=1070872 RepID=A0ABP9HNL0_9ACTN